MKNKTRLGKVGYIFFDNVLFSEHLMGVGVYFPTSHSYDSKHNLFQIMGQLSKPKPNPSLTHLYKPVRI